MSDVNVLVVFYSRYGTAEQLALAAGVGAIQARANIRLRRLADLASRDTIAASLEWTQNLERMNRDYVTPRSADVTWADVLVLATPASSSTELEQYVASLAAIGPVDGKIAAPLAPGNNQSALKPVYAACACAGLIVAPAGDDGGNALASARTFGQRVAEMARVLKRNGSPA